jgi:hypothetical protein
MRFAIAVGGDDCGLARRADRPVAADKDGFA